MSKKRTTDDLKSINDLIHDRLVLAKKTIPVNTEKQDSVRKDSRRKLKEVMKEVNEQFDLDNECWDFDTSNILRSSYKTKPIEFSSKTATKIVTNEDVISHLLNSSSSYGNISSSNMPSSTRSKSMTEEKSKKVANTAASISIEYSDETTDVLGISYHTPLTYSFVLKYTLSKNRVNITGDISSNENSVTNKINIPCFESNGKERNTEDIVGDITNFLMEEFYLKYFFEKESLGKKSSNKSKELKSKRPSTKKEDSAMRSLQNDLIGDLDTDEYELDISDDMLD